jgi:phage baseplate assembly protein gpV
MILSLDELITRLDDERQTDTRASESRWIKFAQHRTAKTVEYRTASGNETVHVYLDEGDALVGIEIFP